MDSKDNHLFFELIQITVGNRCSFSCTLKGEDQLELLEQARKQSLESVLLDGMNKAQLTTAPEIKQQMKEWIAQQYHTILRNCPFRFLVDSERVSP